MSFPLPVASLEVPAHRGFLIPQAAANSTVLGAPPGAPEGAGALPEAEPLVLPPEPVLTVRRDVELIYAGTWSTSTGVFTWDPAHLSAAVAAQDDPAFQTPVVKVGHDEPLWMDGEPALGVIKNLRVNDSSTVLIGDLVGVPSWLAQVMPYAWPDRSIEGFFDWNTNMEVKHPFVLTALALLGVKMGAITRLADLPVVFSAVAPEGTTVAGKPWADAAG